MKNLFVLFLTLLSFSTFSQNTPVGVYVIHNGCPYSVTDTWSSQCGAGNMILDSVDYLGFQDLYHYHIADTCYPINVTMTVYVGATQPPFPQQTPFTTTQSITNWGVITLLADCSILDINELQTSTKNIVKVTDLSGKECELKENEFLIIHFEDGSCEKVFINK